MKMNRVGVIGYACSTGSSMECLLDGNVFRYRELEGAYMVMCGEYVGVVRTKRWRDR